LAAIDLVIKGKQWLETIAPGPDQRTIQEAYVSRPQLTAEVFSREMTYVYSSIVKR
jgi:hypothetical protein